MRDGVGVKPIPPRCLHVSAGAYFTFASTVTSEVVLPLIVVT